MSQLNELLEKINILVIDDRIKENAMLGFFTDLKKELEDFYKKPVIITPVSKFKDIEKIDNFSKYDVIILDLQFNEETEEQEYKYEHPRFYIKGKKQAGKVIFDYIREKNLFVPIILFSAYGMEEIKKIIEVSEKLEYSIVCKQRKHNNEKEDSRNDIFKINKEEKFIYFLYKLYLYCKNNKENMILKIDENNYLIPNEIDVSVEKKDELQIINESGKWFNSIKDKQKKNKDDYKGYKYINNDSNREQNYKKICITKNNSGSSTEDNTNIETGINSGNIPSDGKTHNIVEKIKDYLSIKINYNDYETKKDNQDKKEKENGKKNKKEKNKEQNKENNKEKDKYEIWCAAIPLTAYNTESNNITAYNTESNNINDFYYNKLLALDKMGFDKIVLKTVYEEEEHEQVSSEGKIKNASRVYLCDNDNYNLFNTGKTAKENLSPEELNKFLNFLNGKNIENKLIISLGSHSDNKEIWESLFKKVFENMGEEKFKVVEINARHSIRAMTKKYTRRDDDIKKALLGLDEYFISPDIGTFNGVWAKIENWLEWINQLGIGSKKQIIIKLPYRSDLNIIAFLINKVYEKNNNKEYGINGVSLINTIKSPFIPSCVNIKKQLQLESFDMSKGDFINLPQYSGEDLGFLRNMAIYTVKNILNENIKVYAVGGIVNKHDVMECIKLKVNGVQLSTIALTDLKETKKILDSKNNKIEGNSDAEGRMEPKAVNYDNKNNKIGGNSKFSIYTMYKETRNIKLFVKRTVDWDPYKCQKCGKCVKTAYCDAIINKFSFLDNIDPTIPRNYPVFDKDLCTGCGMCVSHCKYSALSLELDKADIAKCPICNVFHSNNEEGNIYNSISNLSDGSEQFYCEKCDSMLIKRKENIEPLYINGMLKEKTITIDINNKSNQNKIYKINGQQIEFNPNIDYISMLKLKFDDNTKLECENCKEFNYKKYTENNKTIMVVSAYKKKNNKKIIIKAMERKDNIDEFSNI